MRAESPIYSPRGSERRRARSKPLVIGIASAVGLAVAVSALSAYAGSPRELAQGTTVAGVDLGGLTRSQAVKTLERRFDRVSARPVTFTAGDKSFSFAANQLAVEPDWSAAVTAASRAGDGFGPIRGLRRLRARFFGAEVLPRFAVSNGALEYALDRIASRVDSRSQNARLVIDGTKVRIVPGRTGAKLDRNLAAEVIVRTLGSLERAPGSLSLPVQKLAPPVTARMLAAPARRARVALSGPVLLKAENRTWRVPPQRIATLLQLPREGSPRLAIGGRRASTYFEALSSRIGRQPRDATFDVVGERVNVVPARDGLELDVPAAARALLRASLTPTDRIARLTLVRAAPSISTNEALAMGIDTRMAGYKTFYAGTPDRITNLQLGVRAIDGTLIRPGGTFSLNDAIGERTKEKGFRSAPVIVGTEYKEEVGGGTSQVATTVFNAAWEAGLRITERHPHSLYISRYQLGRDATVYWPSLDLKFENDTKHWVLVKGYAESDGIHVVLYGGERRTVESSAEPLVVTGPVPTKIVKDPTLKAGERVVETEGSAPSRTSATRKIYGADGKLIRSETWTTSYEGETRVVRVGTKQAKPKAGKAGKAGKTPTPSGGATTTTPDTGPSGTAVPPP